MDTSETITTMELANAHDVEQAVAAMVSALGPVTDADWTVCAGDLTWTCWQTAAHLAHDLLAYACQVTARPRSAYLPQDLVMRPEASPAQLLQAVQTSASLLVLALESASSEARAWHFGLTDASGFATLALNELLVHTWDVSQGLGLTGEPPSRLARKVLTRLWTDAPEGPAGRVLLWCTGRVALPGHPREEDWVTPSPPPAQGEELDW